MQSLTISGKWNSALSNLNDIVPYRRRDHIPEGDEKRKIREWSNSKADKAKDEASP